MIVTGLSLGSTTQKSHIQTPPHAKLNSQLAPSHLASTQLLDKSFANTHLNRAAPPRALFSEDDSNGPLENPSNTQHLEGINSTNKNTRQDTNTQPLENANLEEFFNTIEQGQAIPSETEIDESNAGYVNKAILTPVDTFGSQGPEFSLIHTYVTEDGFPVAVLIDNEMINKPIESIKDIYDVKYTLDHNDSTGHRILKISQEFQEKPGFYAKIMRDSIFGQWQNIDGNPTLDISMHVNDNPEGPGASWEAGARENKLIPPTFSKEIAKIGGELRKKIFKDHVQDAIQSVVLASKDLIDQFPELKDAKVQLRYLSDLPEVNETTPAGNIQEHLDKPTFDKPQPFATITKAAAIWGEAMSSSSSAAKDLMNAMLKPDTLGPLLKNNKTLIPTLVVLLAMSLLVAKTGSMPK